MPHFTREIDSLQLTKLCRPVSLTQSMRYNRQGQNLRMSQTKKTILYNGEHCAGSTAVSGFPWLLPITVPFLFFGNATTV
jgi:hypothetical protein